MKIALIIEDVNKVAGQERVVAELLARLVPRHEVHLFGYQFSDLPPEVIVHRLRRLPIKSFMVQALWIVIISWLVVRPRDFEAVLSQGGNALNQTHTLVHACHARRWELTRAVYWRLQPPGLLERVIRTVWYGLVVALERRAVRRCRGGRTLAVSHELAELLSRYHGVSREDITVCENGVDHDHFRPDPADPCRAELRAGLGLTESDTLALFLGGLWLEKGAYYSLQALAHCRQPVHLCLAGRDDPAPFAARAAELGISDRLHFWPPTAEPGHYYRAADLFLFPGHAEGFGLVAVEAAACGLPVLMTRVGVAERLITPGESGYLISQEPAEIAARLDELAADPARRQMMGEAAHRAAQQFSWDRQGAAIEAALQERPRP